MNETENLKAEKEREIEGEGQKLNNIDHWAEHRFNYTDFKNEPLIIAPSDRWMWMTAS